MLVAIKADLARRIDPARSNEATRYYLNGFTVEPCESGTGVNIVATDGHLLACFRDAEGVVENPANAEWPIIGLDKSALKACGAKSHATLWLVVEGDATKATLSVAMGTDAAEAIGCHKSGNLAGIEYQATGKFFIDGSFPAWRRVVPSPELELGSAPSFNPQLLARLGKCVQSGKSDPFLTIERQKANPESGPMLVNGGAGQGLEWFGVLMPCRGGSGGLPSWLEPATPTLVAAE